MRKPLPALAALLTLGAVAFAQNPQPAKAPNANDAKLDGYLEKWELKMRDVKMLKAILARTDKDKVMSRTDELVGEASYLRSGEGPSALNMATLELKVKNKAEVAEKMVCTGSYLYVFAPAQKEIRVFEMPKGKTDGGFLDLLFGMKAKDAKQKYNLSLVKEDQWYVYVSVSPKDAKDRAEFTRAQLVLDKNSCLPRQLWFEHNNGNEVTWDVPRVFTTGLNLDRRSFDAPRPPNGWKLVPVAQEKAPQPPRVIRPTNP